MQSPTPEPTLADMLDRHQSTDDYYVVPPSNTQRVVVSYRPGTDSYYVSKEHLNDNHTWEHVHGSSKPVRKRDDAEQQAFRYWRAMAQAQSKYDEAEATTEG